MIANSLKSGLSMLQGIQVVVKNMPNPIAQEFNLLLSQHSLSTNLDDAFINMEHRIPSEDLQMVITSITILSETGGDLTETFETIMHTIGERNKVQGKIKSLTYMGMFQAIILSSLPLALGFALYMMNPAQMMLFFTTKLGWALIVLIVILLSSAFYVIKKIVTIDV
jgi:tight adherence protein B